MESFPFRTVEVLCLGTSITLSGLFYYIYRKKQKTVDKLNKAPQLSLDRNLANILNATPGKCLQYVIVEGNVQPIKEPLRSQFQEGCVGVVQKLVLREHKLVWNSLARTWTDSERILHQRINTVPFNLVGSDEAAVRVLCPLEASGLNMEVVHEKFHQASYSFTDIIGQYLSGEKPKGQLETEEMVKVGTMLTGVGELFLDTDHTLKLRPPTDGSEFFLTPVDFETMRMQQEGQALLWRVLASVCAVAGVAVLLWVARRYYQHLQAEQVREQQRRDFERLSTIEDRDDDDEEVETVDNACVICLSSPRNCVVLDCGHVCCCFRCFQALPQPVCPMCRQPIKRVVPLYQA
ncbi:mitochondrial ubiquitin ligase activator of nfkb 1-A-like [Scleropages formosus]|uniref:RING-type E3 ubiquitin transferase n=1 Tax=Scleropages formosus TaxID=113540 RepID=A0A0N8JWF4_SCLFO|nr:mitochondrial ubiquitin ligase activator of nfkb 1-A-like [Scleropages formosus]KPP60785.1 mitochondrial ubiquitin ligase activator of nfkb 1-A-like [Scleropages formosus]